MKCQARLRNIRFKKIRARILSVEHISRVLVSWEIEPTSQKLDSLRFFIERGESPSEFIRLNGDGIPADGLYEFVDYTASLFDLQKNYYYRVVAEELSSEGEVLQSFVSEEASLDGCLDLAGLYVVEENLFKLEEVSGVPVLFYKKRFEGVKCPECWDDVLKRTTKSNCKTCFGTGRLEGYYPPIEGWVDFSVQTQNAVIQQQGTTQPNKTRCEFTNYPELRPGDVVFEIQNHIFWKVSSITAPEKNRVIMLQNLDLTAVNRSDIEYNLEIPADVVQRLLAKLQERQSIPEF